MANKVYVKKGAYSNNTVKLQKYVSKESFKTITNLNINKS